MIAPRVRIRLAQAESTPGLLLTLVGPALLLLIMILLAVGWIP